MRFSYLVLAFFCGLHVPAQSAERPASPVFIYHVAPSSLEQTFDLMGKLTATQSVALSPAVTETVSAIHFQDGQRVKAGDLLIELTNAEEHAQLTQLQAQLQDAERQYERLAKLKSGKLTSEESLDQKRLAVESAKGQWQAAQARLQDRIILAPFAGQLGLRQLNLGNLVRPGDTLATLEDTSQMYLDVELPEALRDLAEGHTAFSASSLDGRLSLLGQLQHLDKRSQANSHNLIARAILPNPKGDLFSGMTLKVQFVQRLHDQLLVPEAALIQEGTRAYVYVLGSDNTVKPQNLTLSVRQNGWVAISSGLHAGDTIITQGATRLTPGAGVKIMGEDKGQALRDILQQGKP